LGRCASPARRLDVSPGRTGHIVGVMKWEAMLSGHVFDLEDLPLYFDTDPHVLAEGERYWLISSAFDQMQDVVQVQEASRVVVARINGAMRLEDSGFEGVHLSGRYRNETGEHVVVGAGTAVGRAKAGMVTVAGGTPSPRPPGPREYVQLSGTDLAAADVLRIISKGDLDWYDLYKIFEIVREDIGGERVMTAKGWAVASDLSAFRVSANHPGVSGQSARHARQNPGTPKHTMTIGRGRAFIAHLVRSWMTLRLSPPGNPPPIQDP